MSELFSTDPSTKAILAEVAAGDLRAVKEMLESGVSVDAADYFKIRPIHIATGKGNLDMVKFLIAHGCDINARTACPPVAEQREEFKKMVGPEVAHRLASIASQRYVAYVKANESNFGVSPLHAAALHGYLDVAKELVAAKADIHIEDTLKETPLFTAMAQGSHEVALFLIQNGAVVNAVNVDGSTPLHRAAERGNVKAAEVLIANEAAIDATNKNGFTPLHMSLMSRQPEVSEFLIDSGADVNARDNEGRNPLFHAVKNGCPIEVAKLLIEKGASVNDSTDRAARSPLHLAVENDYADITYLLLQNKADVNAADDLMWSPLHYAAYAGNLDIVSTLVLFMGAEVNARTRKQATPLHFAAAHWHVGVVETLLSRGAEVNAGDQANWTPLHYAADGSSTRRNWGQSRAEAQEAKLTTVKALVEKGADINAKGNADETALHVAAKYGDRAVVKCLLENGAYYDQKTGSYFGSSTDLELTAIARNVSVNTLLVATGKLFEAVKKGKCAEVEKCIKEGAPVNSRSIKHETPLMYASWKGHLSVVSVLLAHGADINVTNSNGDTPLHLAAKFGHHGIVCTLLHHGAVYNARTKADEKTPLNYAQDWGRKRVVATLELIERMFTGVSIKDNTVLAELNELKNKNCPELLAIRHCRNLDKETLMQIAKKNDYEDLCNLFSDL